MPPSLGFLVPGRLDERTGGYLYDRRVVDGLRARGWRVDVRELDGDYPFPSAAARDAAGAALASFASGTVVLVDSLALGALPDQLNRERGRLKLVGLVHLPLAAGVGLLPLTVAQLLADERRALAATQLVIVTGSATIPLLAPHGVPSEKIVVVEPGTERAPLARGSGGPGVALLCVGTLNFGKGHEVLFRALAPLRAHAWTLNCVGSAVRDERTVAALRALLRSLGLEDRVTLAGELDAQGVERAYDGADVFVTATLRETYGMSVAEALAHGLPVIGTRTGAIAELVGDEAGLVVRPGRATDLSEALARVLGDAALRERFAAGARSVRDRLPTWEHATGKMEAVLERVGPS
jgi:glycosyltransferase involved in cell wall biosynthesis